MAKEIWVSSISNQQISLVFLANIVTAGGTIAVDKDGANVIYTPSTTLPTDLKAVMAADVTAGGGADWIAALDAGTALFWTSEYVPVAGETGPQALAKVRAMYSAQLPSEIAAYTTYTKYSARKFQAFDAI